MKTTNYRKCGYSLWILAFLALIMSVLLPAQSALAAPVNPQGSTGGLMVSGAIIDLKATPGLVYVHKMTVGVGTKSPAVDVTVEVLGFGQSLDGAFQVVPAEQDQNPYSARSYITAINNPKFHLNPGDNVPLEVTVTVPADPGKDTRYASVYIKGVPSSGGNVTQILAVLVPVVITPEGVELKNTAEITSLKVDPVEAGKPIQITTTVKNTGNHHFKVKEDLKLISPSGETVANLTLPLTSTSIIPTFSRDLVASYAALDQQGGLSAGTYTAEGNVVMEDGTVVGTKQVQFEIPKVYRPFSAIGDQHIQIKCFKDEEPGEIDAREKADTRVTFEGVGKVTGCVAIGKFSTDPGGSPLFTDKIEDGGIGTQAIKFIGIQVQGFNQGIAHISVNYSNNELNGNNPNNMFLAFRSGNQWEKMDNLVVQTGVGSVIGDVHVSVLNDGPVTALGASNENPMAFINNPFILGGIGIGILLLVLLIVVIVLLLRTRRHPMQPRSHSS